MEQFSAKLEFLNSNEAGELLNVRLNSVKQAFLQNALT
jgi:hypothetical protein